MKKYQEWEKYVREQTREMKSAVRQDDAQSKSALRHGGIPGAGAGQSHVVQSPITRKDVVIKRNYKVNVEKPGNEGHPAATIPSPFVSVHDVWKAAEKSVKGKTSPPAGRQAGEPRAGRLTHQPHAAYQRQTAARTSSQTREEILERLINPTLTLDEAAKIMGVCKATVRRYTVKGILPHYRTPGNQRRFKLNDVLNFLDKQRS
ncbi:MAG: helix-turn-helix domain-containing protein [bacterium]